MIKIADLGPGLGQFGCSAYHSPYIVGLQARCGYKTGEYHATAEAKNAKKEDLTAKNAKKLKEEDCSWALVTLTTITKVTAGSLPLAWIRLALGDLMISD